MAVVKLTQFGGIMPSAQARRLPDESAQTAHNLDLSYGDFRPLAEAGASVATVATATKSIFRTPSGVWLSSLNDVNYVNAQINDADSERVYLTGRVAYPEAWESGVYRQLGVPQPTVAPAVTLNVVDEFDRDELSAATPAIIAAIEESVRNNVSDTRFGGEPQPQTPPALGGLDPSFERVQLHLRFDGTVGEQLITDSSRVARTVNAGTVTLASSSPLPGGNQWGAFTGGEGLSFGLIRAEAHQSWALEFFYSASSAASEIKVQAWGGYVTLVDATGAYTLASRLDRNTNDRTVLSAPGSYPAATLRKIQLLSGPVTGLELYIDGVLEASGAALGLELSGIGWTRNNFGSFTGNMDEVRVTVGAARSASASIDVFPAAPTTDGFWLEHGTVTTPALPTSNEGDWAYLVPLAYIDDQYVAASEVNQYLLNPVFGGTRVNYSSTEWWAVPVSYQGMGYTLNTSAMLAALQSILNPDTGAQLIPLDVANTIVEAYFARVDPTQEPVRTYVNRVNTGQDTLDVQLAADDLSDTRQGTVLMAVSQLNTATTNITAYFSDLLAGLTLSATDTFETYVRALLPEAVTRIVEPRAYVYTYVTDWGEESAPSPASVLVEADQNDTVTVVPTAPPSGRNVVGWRLYRSSTTNISAAYQLVADKAAANAVLDGADFDYYAIGTLTLTDDQLQEELQETMQTLTWAEPPAALLGLVGLPNGMMAGFYGKTVCLCEPFAPYAWPLEYQLTVEYNVVGLGVFGQTLVVLTEGHPYYGSGADSASFSLQKLENTQACLAKRTIASMEGGVVFASPDGLCLASPNGVQVLTTGAFDRDDWQALDVPNSYGGFHEGVYYLFTPEVA